MATLGADEESARVAKIWEWWKGTLNSPTRVLAPMVDQSELPFRMLTRKYGADICYTPMIHARLYSERDDVHREKMFNTEALDRPLFAQFCGNEPQVLLQAALALQDRCDAVDLNLGCPQGIARKGRYGAYLLEEQETVLEIVRTLSAGLRVPVSVKIRLLGDREATVDYARRIVAAGASVLTVHGRTKEEKGHATRMSDWEMIRRVKAAVAIPVIANGGVATPEDMERCMEVTGCDAVMSSEMSLSAPDIFRRPGVPRTSTDTLVSEYMALARKYDIYGGAKMARAHLFKMLYPALPQHVDLRDRLVMADSLEELEQVASELASRGWEAKVAAEAAAAAAAHTAESAERRAVTAAAAAGAEGGAAGASHPPVAAGSGGGGSSDHDGDGTGLDQAATTHTHGEGGPDPWLLRTWYWRHRKGGGEKTKAANEVAEGAAAYQSGPTNAQTEKYRAAMDAAVAAATTAAGGKLSKRQRNRAKRQAIKMEKKAAKKQKREEERQKVAEHEREKGTEKDGGQDMGIEKGAGAGSELSVALSAAGAAPAGDVAAGGECAACEEVE